MLLWLLALPIFPGDSLVIQVWPDTLLVMGERVSEDGYITLKYIGPLKVAGLEPESLRLALEALYSKIVVEPQVHLVRYYPVYVLGEVRRPGRQYITGTESVISVIANAGPTGDGDMGRIVLIKSKSAERVNLSRAARSGQSAIEAGVEPGDVILVPKNFWVRWREWSALVGFVNLVVTVLIWLNR